MQLWFALDSVSQHIQVESKPLGAIANIFSSGVGMTAESWSINGIPYYALNEEGSIGGGDHGKVMCTFTFPCLVAYTFRQYSNVKLTR